MLVLRSNAPEVGDQHDEVDQIDHHEDRQDENQNVHHAWETPVEGHCDLDYPPCLGDLQASSHRSRPPVLG